MKPEFKLLDKYLEVYNTYVDYKTFKEDNVYNLGIHNIINPIRKILVQTYNLMLPDIYHTNILIDIENCSLRYVAQRDRDHDAKDITKPLNELSEALEVIFERELRILIRNRVEDDDNARRAAYFDLVTDCKLRAIIENV